MPETGGGRQAIEAMVFRKGGSEGLSETETEDRTRMWMGEFARAAREVGASG